MTPKHFICMATGFLFAGSSLWAEDSRESRMLGRMAEGVSYAERVQMVQNADKSRIGELFEVVANASYAKDLSTAQERSLINETLNRIQQIGDVDSGVEALLEDVSKDPTRDPGVREYALQHLFLWHPKSAYQDDIKRVFWEMTDGSILSSVSLLYLHRLESTGDVRDNQQLDAAILKAMRSYAPRDADKITLMSVASERGLTAGLPIIREWAHGPSWLVSVSAADSIGWLGDANDLRYLKDDIGIETIREGAAALKRAEAHVALRWKGIRK